LNQNKKSMNPLWKNTGTLGRRVLLISSTPSFPRNCGGLAVRLKVGKVVGVTDLITFETSGHKKPRPVNGPGSFLSLCKEIVLAIILCGACLLR
jgi:hypothetical protein